MRKIKEFNDNNGIVVKVYYNNEWCEYVARLFIDGDEHVDSSYHTDDKQDALDTAESMILFECNKR